MIRHFSIMPWTIVGHVYKHVTIVSNSVIPNSIVLYSTSASDVSYDTFGRL